MSKNDTKAINDGISLLDANFGDAIELTIEGKKLVATGANGFVCWTASMLRGRGAYILREVARVA